MPENSGGETMRVDTFLESSLDSVDRAEEMARAVASSVGFKGEDIEKIAMAVRESMVNAVVHGNRYNANKKVHFLVCNAPDHITIRIADEGDGFDPADLPDPLAEGNLLRYSGRGIFLIQAFVDEFRVRRLEPAGTEVQLTKYLMHS
jgi:serine/threonine-protein kinase RsbW